MADKIVVLNAGRIEQIGSPLELYERPANLFVAGFIGSPKMNFFPGELPGRGRAHTLGIRPEHIQICQPGEGIGGVVGVSEHLGSDTFLHIHGTDLAETLTVRTSGEIALHHGDEVGLEFPAERCHAFDADGNRVEAF